MSVHARVLLLFALITSPLAAQSTMQRLLVPVSISEPVQGANGSVWITELTVRNNSSDPVSLDGIVADCPGITCGAWVHVPPKQTVVLVPAVLSPDSDPPRNGPGASIVISSNEIDDVTFNLRVQDLSRQSSTWGTALPVVKESEFLAAPASLVNVPYGKDFRHTLRVYDLDDWTGPEVDVLLYAAEAEWAAFDIPTRPDRLLGSKRFRLTPPPSGWEGRAPAYLELNDLNDIVLNDIAEIADVNRLVVQVVPVTAGMRYWAFISVTNNETQHVTTILP